MNCTHHLCRCARADELMRIADRTGKRGYALDAIAAHDSEVPCRLLPSATTAQQPVIRSRPPIPASEIPS